MPEERVDDHGSTTKYSEREYVNVRGERMRARTLTKTYSGRPENLRCDPDGAKADRANRRDHNHDAGTRGGNDQAGHLHGTQQGPGDGESVAQATSDRRNLSAQSELMNRQGSTWARAENDIASYRDETGESITMSVTVYEKYDSKTGRYREISRDVDLRDSGGDTPRELSHHTSDRNLTFANPASQRIREEAPSPCNRQPSTVIDISEYRRRRESLEVEQSAHDIARDTERSANERSVSRHNEHEGGMEEAGDESKDGHGLANCDRDESEKERE